MEARAADLYIKNREQGVYEYASDLIDLKINPFVKEMQSFEIVQKKIQERLSFLNKQTNDKIKNLDDATAETT